MLNLTCQCQLGVSGDSWSHSSAAESWHHEYEGILSPCLCNFPGMRRRCSLSAWTGKCACLSPGWTLSAWWPMLWSYEKTCKKWLNKMKRTVVDMKWNKQYVSELNTWCKGHRGSWGTVQHQSVESRPVFLEHAPADAKVSNITWTIRCV